MEKILSISLKLNFTPNTSGCYGLREIRRFFFPLNYAILSFGKCLNYYISGFRGNDINKILDNTELKTSSKINISVSELHHWAVEGY